MLLLLLLGNYRHFSAIVSIHSACIEIVHLSSFVVQYFSGIAVNTEISNSSEVFHSDQNSATQVIQGIGKLGFFITF